MAWTQGDLDAINQAIATGATIVKYGNSEVKYRNLEELKQTKVLIEQSLSGKQRQSRRYGVYDKTGW